MARQPYDSFLPSGAVPSPPVLSPGSLNYNSIPRSVPDYFSLNTTRSRPHQQQQPYSRSSSVQRRPISPPKTRSASAEEKASSMIEDWRAYTKKLRDQAEGERKHMAADRDRIQEVQAEERALWDAEREVLKARIVEQELRITELEAELERRGGASRIVSPSAGKISPAAGGRERSYGHGQAPLGALTYATGSNAITTTGSLSVSTASPIPQESGRNTDGTPFYAPNAEKPSRIFDAHGPIASLPLNTISIPGESLIGFPSKELTPSDFVQSPNSVRGDLGTIPETPSIDISELQPGAEGITIKASAVAPSFISPIGPTPTVLSPSKAPDRLSPNEKENSPPRSRETSQERAERVKGKVDAKALMGQPEDKRLKMHAGHTPNHSISRLGQGDFKLETGTATPTQANTVANHVHHTTEDSEEAADDDKELTGQLGLTNSPAKDKPFLTALTEKLEEVARSRPASPDEENPTVSVGTQSTDDILDGDDEEQELPLKLKKSMNFGTELGSFRSHLP